MRGADLTAQGLKRPALVDGRSQPPLCLGLRPPHQPLPAGITGLMFTRIGYRPQSATDVLQLIASVCMAASRCMHAPYFSPHLFCKCRSRSSRSAMPPLAGLKCRRML